MKMNVLELETHIYLKIATIQISLSKKKEKKSEKSNLNKIRRIGTVFVNKLAFFSNSFANVSR